MPITLKDLTVDFSHLDRASILSDWQWLVGPDLHPILITALGDAFLQDSRDGSVHLLSCGAATLDSVCSNLEEFEGRLKDQDFVLEHFVPTVVVALRASGKNLRTGHLYGYKVPPHLGGEYSEENSRTDGHVGSFFAYGAASCADPQPGCRNSHRRGGYKVVVLAGSNQRVKRP